MGFLSRPVDLTANFIGNTEDERYHRKAISKNQNGKLQDKLSTFFNKLQGEKGKDT